VGGAVQPDVHAGQSEPSRRSSAPRKYVARRTRQYSANYLRQKALGDSTAPSEGQTLLAHWATLGSKGVSHSRESRHALADLSWQDAITKVLEEAGKPLHYADIAQTVIDSGLRENVGATPANTVASIVSQSIKDLGDDSPFIKSERGIYGLRKTANEEPTLEAQDEAEEDAERMGLINAFGMFWRRDLVIWVPTEPQLFGQQQAGSDAINFAAQAGVYILYDGDRVIYVGRVTGERLSKRLKEHTRDRLNGRWDRFSWFGVRKPSGSGELQSAPNSFDLDNLVATMEALLIEGLEPPQNRRQGDNFNAVEFIQVADPQIEREQMRRLLVEVSKHI
jgi:hypothetical protein